MKAFQKMTLLLLALTMVLTLFAACGKDKTNTEPTVDSTVDTSDPNDPKLEAIDGGGENFHFLCREAGSSYLYKYSEVLDTEEYGEAVNDAVVKRNSVIEEKYDVVITTQITPWEFVQLMEKDAMAELNSYDIVMPMVEQAFLAACKGMLTEWDNIPYVNESKDYWMTHVWESTSLGGYQFFCPGALNLSAYNTVQVMFFNKAMHQSLALANIYDMVKEKTWTQDAMYSMAKQATVDLDGEGMGEGDQYGVVSGSVCWQSFYYASGKTLITKDENDLPELSALDNDSEKFYDMLTYIITNMNDNTQAGTSNLIGWSGAVPEHFVANKCLFFVEGIYGQYKLLDMSNPYGIVPIPTWEAGADYYAFLHATHSSVSAIPVRVDDLNICGSILEDIMYYSDKMVIPTYYEDIIHTRNVRDAESYEMLDIVFENIIIDLAQVMKSSGLGIDQAIRDFVDQNVTDTIASTLSGNKEVYEDLIGKLAVAFTNEGAKQYT